ncbi:cell division septal protein FtsQ [Curtobacterium sp. 320]|uniref:FtsQ-type POTRA domain-containing protein n=2 Tax=unclassified Curtobacterium TaxID=257496 RepID=UPI0028659A37|nr:FtsQ-type POTRA domain-containing protein [Curtobacterium sp. 320]MDR6572594.1 cell division septal protein FtsQ [Curtobacterium sp. 320]
MKRPEGFDERPARPDAPADGAGAPRQRRAPLIPRRPSREPEPVVQEARLAPATEEPVVETADPTAADSSSGSARDRAGALAGAAGRRLGAGLSSVAGRLREYTPDEDHHDPEAERLARERQETERRDAERLAHLTDLHGPDEDGHERPIGAGVRAAETAREARVAKRRRRLLERAEVRRFTRRSRHRRAAWITAASIVLVFGISILVAVFSPLMALQTIEVKGTNRVDETQLRQALSDQIGTPLARLDFDAIKKDIAGFPLIESYVTEEAPPHTLVVTVTERTPVVAVRSGKSFDLVDPAGIVVQSSPKQPANMPVADIGNAKLGSSEFRTMTEVVLALPSTVRQQVTSVKGSTADDVTLTLKDGSSVVWGNPEQSDAKAALLAALVKDHAARNPGVVVEYDVSAPDNGIIRAKK